MDWAYNLMMAILNRETLLILGHSRFKHDLEEKMLKDHKEWEEYKRENKRKYPLVKLQRLKLDNLGATPGLCRAP